MMWRTTRVGIGAALSTPRWLSERRLASLLTLASKPEPTPSKNKSKEKDRNKDKKKSQTPTIDAKRAIQISHTALRILSYIPASPWRNTCLYQSISECLVLRSAGVAARVVIGIKKDSDAVEDSRAASNALTNRIPVNAHAWVETMGEQRDSYPGYTLLKLSSVPKSPVSKVPTLSGR